MNISKELGRCSACMRCSAVCPSGVDPYMMIAEARAYTTAAIGLPITKSLALEVVSNEVLHGFAFASGAFAQRLGLTHLVPRALVPTGIDLSHFPFEARSFRSTIPEFSPASVGQERVAFFVGCMVDHSLPNIGRATLRVMKNLGVNVLIPKRLRCCGTPAIVSGDMKKARLLAKHNLQILDQLAVDHIITVCATCGEALRNCYPELFRDTSLADLANRVARKTIDVCAFLSRRINRAQLGNIDLRVTYHDPCHLVRGQGISLEPRQLAKAVPGIEFREMPEADHCCGAAGLFQVLFPNEAWKITKQKLDNVRATGATVVLTACPGCVQRLHTGLRQLEMPQSAMHIVELLDQAMEARGQIKQNISGHQAIKLDNQCKNAYSVEQTGQLPSRRSPVGEKRRNASMVSPGIFSWAASKGFKLAKNHPDLGMLGDVIPQQRIWACTTCYACVDTCPVLIRPTDLVMAMRRYLVEQGALPATAAKSLEQTLDLGSPWGQPQSQRADWAKDLRVKTLQPGEEVDLLYWVGDTSAFDIDAQAIPKAMVQILRLAGIDFGILGVAEQSDGEASRRLGEEGLFQLLAQQNVNNLRRYKFNAILTHCPHSYNTFVNEYREVGGDFQVLHHSQLLLDLLQRGVLRPTRPIGERVTYHDPCYLGRHSQLYDEPRSLLQSLPGLDLVEMERSRENALCCGAGGGLAWIDVSGPHRLNHLLLNEVENAHVSTVATACPLCKMMLCDAARYEQAEHLLKVRDIAELVMDTQPQGAS